MSAFERLFSGQGAGTASPVASQSIISSATTPTVAAVVAAALLCSLLAAAALSKFFAGLAGFLRVRRGLKGIPRAPGGSALLGHVLPLMRGTPWDVMEDWVRETSAFAKEKSESKKGGESGESGKSGDNGAKTSSSSSSPSLGPPCPEGMCVASVGHRKLLVVGSAPAAREIFQTKARRFSKDLDFSFKPFLPILGTGLVTASGGLWQSQRLLIAPALRVDILEAVPRIAVAAAERLARKLERALAAEAEAQAEAKARAEAAAAAASALAAAAVAAAASAGEEEGSVPKSASGTRRGDVSPASVMLSPASRAGSAASLAGSTAEAAAGTATAAATTANPSLPPPPPPLSSLAGVEAVVDMEEEFRLLTLQIIGEAVLSLPPEECDRVFPELYLPVMEEANLRALRPWRALVPGEARRKYARGIRALDAYIRALLRERWAERKARSNASKAAADEAAASAAGKEDSNASSAPPPASSSPPPTSPPPAKKGDERDDILETMLAAIEHRGEEWSFALETQLCFEVKTFLLAGHETSAAMLTWSLYELGRGDARLPESVKVAAAAEDAEAREGLAVRDPAAAAALARVRKEAESVLKLPASPLKSSAAPPIIPTRKAAEEGFEFSLACLKESLRKYSVVPVVTRVAAEDTTLCGRRVPRGTYVAICIQAVHNNTVGALGGWRCPASWEPERFLPGGEAETMPDSARVERAKKATTTSGEEDDETDDEEELVEGLRAFNYLPFIQGPRNCLGQYFALLEARIVLARLVAGFDFVKATPGEARRHPAVIPTGPEGGMPMRVRLRK